MRLRTFIALALVLGALLAAAAPAQAAGNSRVAAIQVALQARGFYRGTIDGYYGPGTQHAVIRFQRRRGLLADGIAGRVTRRSLGRYGRPLLGRRVLVQGRVGFDHDIVDESFRIGKRHIRAIEVFRPLVINKKKVIATRPTGDVDGLS